MGRGRVWGWLVIPVLLAVLISGCSDDDGDRPTLFIGGIPDQDATTLERTFGLMAEYLAKQTGLDVQYQPSVEYAAIVTAFRRDDVQLAWFGGLTGVQARVQVANAQAIAQRPRDAEFHSVVIKRAGLEIESLEDVAGHSLTFGSESSTSGHLMPRYFLSEAGVAPDTDLDGPPNFSGSHDTTYKLVESGAFEVGALSEAVWEAAVANGSVGTKLVEVFYVTPPYFDYHWVVRGDLDDRYGDGTLQAIEDALFALNAEIGEDEAELLTLFATDSFVATINSNYTAIQSVAEQLGILE